MGRLVALAMAPTTAPCDSVTTATDCMAYVFFFQGSYLCRTVHSGSPSVGTVAHLFTNTVSIGLRYDAKLPRPACYLMTSAWFTHEVLLMTVLIGVSLDSFRVLLAVDFWVPAFTVVQAAPHLPVRSGAGSPLPSQL